MAEPVPLYEDNRYKCIVVQGSQNGTSPHEFFGSWEVNVTLTPKTVGTKTALSNEKNPPVLFFVRLLTRKVSASH